MTKQQMFIHRQNVAKRKAEGVREFTIDMAVKYGETQSGLRTHYWSKREVATYEKLKRAAGRAEQSFFKFLKTIQKRDFSVGVPAWWIRDVLTYEDATTTGALSVVPPPAYGYTELSVQQFAGAL